MALEDALRNVGVVLPDTVSSYYSEILRSCDVAFTVASQAKSQGLDATSRPDSKLVIDLADRVGEMLGLSQLEGFTQRLRHLLRTVGKERAAIAIAQEIALGKFGHFDLPRALEYAVRTGLAIMTDGVTIAPIQGLYAVTVKQNEDGSEYASLSFAGPIRSAGGTEAAFTLVVADIVAKKLGLSRYIVQEEEVGRFIEELRIYEREVGNFQYRVTDEDIRYALLNIPVEIDGVETDPVEVVIHRDLKRITTNRVRGGALRVLNDGLIGRAHKLVRKLSDLGVEGWGWLSEIKGAKQRSANEVETNSAHFEDVISGRAVLSFPKRSGGFRLRYGRSMNTGLSTVGIHPALAVLLDYPVVVGTQVKIDIPGKAATIAFVDSIEPPTVLLRNGSVRKIRTVEEAKQKKGEVELILDNGDVLISYGDFLENNKQLPPSPYVIEWWIHDLKDALEKYRASVEFTEEERAKLDRIIQNPFDTLLSVEEALKLCRNLRIPLYPPYTPRLDRLSIPEFLNLITKMRVEPDGVVFPREKDVETILRKILVEYDVFQEKVVMSECWSKIFLELFWQKQIPPLHKVKNTLEMVEEMSGIRLGPQDTRTIGMRVGRPEKAMLRKMKPPVNCLFPVGMLGGQRRDILQAAKHNVIAVPVANVVCPKCKERKITAICERCGTNTERFLTCPRCGNKTDAEICPRCKIQTVTWSVASIDLHSALRRAQEKLGIASLPSIKGVKSLTSQSKLPEILEKGVLRSKYGLYVYKDGTIRIDVTNAPLTHFRPRDIGTTIERLRKLGYDVDVEGRELSDENQILELKPQDIIVPANISTILAKIASFIDEELTKIYGKEPFYRIQTSDDLIGTLVLALAPHTSVGVVGRIIGFSNAQVCFANPCWHAAKRRDCDGDGDSIILLLDALLNFSLEYVPDQIGGLMDVPLMIQPVVLPSEVDEQAHNFDISWSYPKKLYEETRTSVPATNLEGLIETIKTRLNTGHEFNGFGFTHPTSSVTISVQRSAYPSLKSLKQKISKQIEIAVKVNAVSADEVVKAIVKTHLIRDIMGNTKKYATQSFKCKKCGVVYRRFPLIGRCSECGGEIRETLSRRSVTKYLAIAKSLTNDFKVDDYTKWRLRSLELELEQLMPSERSDQTQLVDFG